MSPLSGADEPNDDQWGQTLFESGSASSIDEDQTSKNPSSRKQQNQNHQQQPPEQLKCPRCSSMNTKFCYYNNYNKSQPRHFCKGCKRHWTKGGTLRNVPVGGGRKNKRLRTSAPAHAAPPTTAKSQPEVLNFPMVNLKNHHHQQQQQQQQYPSSSWMLPLHQEQVTLPFSFSSSSHFDSIIPSSFPASNVDEHVESSSTVTAITPTDSAVFSHPWQGPNSYWNWNEVADPFISSDLNISWDDIEIKP